MLQYVLAGIALGSIYAIASASIVVTYVSAGVLNFSFGAMAYVIARLFFYLNSQHGWSVFEAAVASLLIAAPLMGVVLYGLLFRHLRGKSTLVKLVATIGLSVALPNLADLTLGKAPSITTAPGLGGISDHVYHVNGTPITTDQLITYAFLVLVVGGGVTILRYTQVGLRVNAVVDSEAMASLSGTNPNRLALGVWAVSGSLAGLAGILVAPTAGLDANSMNTLMVAAFAAVVASRMRSLAGAVAASLAIGLVTDVMQKYVPANSSLTAALVPSIPFGFMLVALIYYLIRMGSLREEGKNSGFLDQAIKPANKEVDAPEVDAISRTRLGIGLGMVPMVVIVLLPVIFKRSAFWEGLIAIGICYAIIFVTFTLVTGEGGMLWLSQVAFAGTGAIAAAQFHLSWHVPVLLAIVMAAVLSAAVGAVIGLLTIRLGDLYLALTTLTFSLLVEELVFTRSRFNAGGIGAEFPRPSWLSSDFRFSYLALAVFILFAILTINLRRSTSGLALRAVRDSEAAARTTGLSVVQVKVLVGAIGAFVAAVGGGLYGLQSGAAYPSYFSTFGGLVWLAVVATLGTRSLTAAALAGLSFSLIPNGLFITYLPARWGEVPAILFGLGAIGVAKHPEGAVAQQGKVLKRVTANLLLRLFSHSPALAVESGPTDPVRTPEAPPVLSPGKGKVAP